MYVINTDLVEGRLADSDIEKIKGLLEKTREQEQWQHFAYQATHMQILAGGVEV